MSADVRLVGLRKEFVSRDKQERVVVAANNVDLEFEKGKLVTLLGPSGCGKSTLLRMIAGFEEPTAGDIYFGDRRVNDYPPNVRDAAMVFQSYAIFPHLNVFDNIAFGLKLKHLARDDVERRVSEVLELTGLTGLARRSPGQLSGGQQQRVALARCIVMEPRLLLFDEPLSNLDAKLREQMRVEIRDLQQRLGTTSIYVTHDQVEAMSISDQLVIINAGAVEQVGSPREVYTKPANRFVADFIGKANFVPAIVSAADAVEVAGVRLELTDTTSMLQGSRVTLVVRPEAFHISADQGDFRGTVRRAMFLGSIAEYMVDIGQVGEWLVEVPNPAEAGFFGPGSTVFVTPSRPSIHLLPEGA
jgi:iron(III) transport system ATP-binding protein